MEDARLMIEQTLATCNNYLHTGRPNKAIQLLNVIKRIDPDNPVMKQMFDYVAVRAMGVRQPDMSEWFGYNWWGEDLDGKSIVIFCDQGMGDTINMLRYLYVMKERWPECSITLNNYAFYRQFKELLEQVDVTDFVAEHVKCDYHTNILCLPSLLNGLQVVDHYPTPFEAVLETSIPQQPLLSAKEVTITPDRPCAGISWRSNPNNVLSKLKSIPDEEIEVLKQSGVNIYSLMPLHDSVFAPIETLADTAAIIAAMDVVVSVDTVVLHLAGAMGKTTFGLLPKRADPRWADGETTVWYPSVRLFRQTTEDDWSEPLSRVEYELASLT